MARISSTTQELRELFDAQITVRFLAMPVEGVRPDDDGLEVRRWMTESDFDVTLVRSEDQRALGYVAREELRPGAAAEQVRHLGADCLIAESTPLLQLFELFRERPWRFVLHRDRVTGIVTRGDLRRAPVRMYLFALVNLLEMHLNRIIREEYPEESWLRLLKPNRVEEARGILAQRQAKNDAIDLVDCLQIADKREIVVQSPSLRFALGFSSKKAAGRFFRRTEDLRNGLAHAQDLLYGTSWADLFELAEQLEVVIQRCEVLERGAGPAPS